MIGSYGLKFGRRGAVVLGLLAFSSGAEQQIRPMLDQQTNISLLDAVRLTLSEDPAIKIQEQQREISRGILQEATGQFDVNVESALSRNISRLPLTDTNRLKLDT